VPAALALVPAALAGEPPLTPWEKAALLVVSGLPAPPGVGGVIVFAADRDAPRPPGAIVFTDQEGGAVKRFPDLPPAVAASAYRTAAAAFASGRATGVALRAEGVHVDLAPVLDLPDGPLGSRHFDHPDLAVAFARGLAAGGAGACAKHFPGLGSTSQSTDVARVRGVVRGQEVAGFRDAVRAGVPCIMVGHAVYGRLGTRQASLEPKTYALLRGLGFRGVAITDSLTPLGPGAPRWGRLAVAAGADLVLVQNAAHADDVIRALLPLARRGQLDEHVARVLAFRRTLGLRAPG
jgi:beta-N-acetylhexosaminidase